MRGACGVADECLDAAEARGDPGELERVAEAHGRIDTALDLEREHSPEASCELALGDVVVWMAREARIVHTLDLGVCLEEFGERLSVLAVSLHSERERGKSPNGEPGVEGLHGAADVE